MDANDNDSDGSGNSKAVVKMTITFRQNRTSLSFPSVQYHPSEHLLHAPKEWSHIECM